MNRILRLAARRRNRRRLSDVYKLKCSGVISVISWIAALHANARGFKEYFISSPKFNVDVIHSICAMISCSGWFILWVVRRCLPVIRVTGAWHAFYGLCRECHSVVRDYDFRGSMSQQKEDFWDFMSSPCVKRYKNPPVRLSRRG